MLEVHAALQLVIEHTGRNAATKLPLDESLGCVLADDITSDVDSPPHDKAMVDRMQRRVIELAGGRVIRDEQVGSYDQ